MDRGPSRESVPMRQFLLSVLWIIGPVSSGIPLSAQVIREGPSDTTESTTEGLSGLTTEGLDSGNLGLEGSGLSSDASGPGFVGVPSNQEFVGGIRESTTNSTVNRLFRAITGEEVPTGGTRESSGQPRRVPVSLRLGFTAPSPRAATALAGPMQRSLDRYLTTRPELADVLVLVDDAGVATLSGAVSDPSLRRLAANLIRLQPGIRSVRNEIDVQLLPPVSQ